jgi:hypothetical protein
MAMGAFPIQTGTSCASEWIQSDSSGAIVSLAIKGDLDDSINRALSDDALVDAAQKINSSSILAKYTKSEMTARVQNLYLEIAESGASAAGS